MHAAILALAAFIPQPAEMPLVHIGMADGTRVTAIAGGEQPLWVATDARGERLHEPMSLDDLRVNQRAIFQRLTNGVADDVDLDDGRPLTWAGV